MDEPTSTHHRAWEAATIAILVIIIIGAGFALYKHLGLPPAPQAPEPAPAQSRLTPPPVQPQGQDLGTDLYVKSTNPLQDKIPATIAPVPNPIQNVYKNPFQ